MYTDLRGPQVTFEGRLLRKSEGLSDGVFQRSVGVVETRTEICVYLRPSAVRFLAVERTHCVS
jgi:hypothetical protein